MRNALTLSALLGHSLLQAADYAAVMMGGTLFILLFTLIIALMFHLKKLYRENLKYRLLFRRSAEPTLLLGTKGTVLDLNDSAAALLGYTKERLVGQKWYAKLLPDKAETVIRERLDKALRRRDVEYFNAQIVGADGLLHEAACRLTPLPKPLRGAVLTFEKSA